MEDERPRKPAAAIFDMDGTLCDVSSIRYHVDRRDPRFSGRKRFDRFHGQSHLCPPNRQALRLYEKYRVDHAVLIVTARKAMWSMHTLLWLRDNHVEHDALYMRADNDSRPDYEVKRDILTEIRKDYTVMVAVDDNPAVLRLWKEEGIKTHRIPGWKD